MRNIRMRLELGFYANHPDGLSELRLVDDSTGREYARLQMNASQFRDFIASGGVKVDVTVPPFAAMELLGADMQVETVKIASSVYAKDKSTRMSEAPPSVRRFCDELAHTHRATAAANQRVEIEARNTNAGWQALVRTYTLRSDAQ